MDFPDGFFSGAWIWGAHILFFIILSIAIFKAPWKPLLTQSSLQHLFLGTCMIMILLWSLRAGISAGLSIHFLGVTTLTLMFSWHLAIIAVSIILFAQSILGLEGWSTFSLNALVSGVIPIMMTYLIYRLSQRFLPEHLIIYIFICSFFGAAIATATAIYATIGLLLINQIYSFAQIQYEYLGFLPLILFPEALLNGMLITILVFIKPEWVLTFDEDKYITGK